MAYVPPRPSELSALIAFDLPDATSDGYGNVSDDWTEAVTTVAARLRPLRGGEGVQAARMAGLSQYEVTVRLSAKTCDVGPRHRVRVLSGPSGLTTLNVRWVANLDERNRFLVLQCESGGNAG